MKPINNLPKNKISLKYLYKKSFNYLCFAKFYKIYDLLNFN